MFPYSILAVLWLLLFHGGESRNKVNIMNGKVIRHLDIKMTRDIFWLMVGKEKGKQPYSPSLLHLLPILFFIGAPFPSPALFSFCLPMLPTYVLSSHVTSRPMWKGNADWCATCNRNSLSCLILPFSHTGLTCLFQSPVCSTSFEGPLMDVLLSWP